MLNINQTRVDRDKPRDLEFERWFMDWGWLRVTNWTTHLLHVNALKLGVGWGGAVMAHKILETAWSPALWLWAWNWDLDSGLLIYIVYLEPISKESVVKKSVSYDELNHNNDKVEELTENKTTKVDIVSEKENMFVS